MKFKLTNKIISPSLILSLIFLLGLAIRLYKLDFQSFWLDEYYDIQAALQPGIFFPTPANLPPVYINLLKVWIRIFPVTETYVRLLGASIGAFSILVFYKLGKELFNVKTGLWAAFLLAVSATHVDYCQEAKYYSLTLLMAMLMQLWYFRILKHGRQTDFIYYAVVMVLGLFTHYYLVILLVTQAAHFLFCLKSQKPKARKFFLVQITVFIIFFLFNL